MPQASLRVLVLFELPSKARHDYQNNLEKILKHKDWEDERHVVKSLERLGHKPYLCGFSNLLKPVMETIDSVNPDIVFKIALKLAAVVFESIPAPQDIFSFS